MPRSSVFASLLASLALATACSREPSFDERYEAQSAKIDSTAKNIEDELGRQLDASVAAGRFRTDPPPPPPVRRTTQP